MSDDAEDLKSALQRQQAFSRWGDDGGAAPGRPEPEVKAEIPPFPKMGTAELEALHVRVIALENLVIALLAAGTDTQQAMARDMAALIAPKPGFTRHPLTTHASAHMSELVQRAVRFGGRTPPA